MLVRLNYYRYSFDRVQKRAVKRTRLNNKSRNSKVIAVKQQNKKCDVLKHFKNFDLKVNPAVVRLKHRINTYIFVRFTASSPTNVVCHKIYQLNFNCLCSGKGFTANVRTRQNSQHVIIQQLASIHAR